MSTSHIPRALRTETETFFERQCAYCRSPQALMNVAYEVDHIVPENAGGPTISGNLALACPLCNGYKGAQTHGREPESGRRVSLYHPRTQRWSRHFQWSDDRCTIVGRTQCGRATVTALRLNNPYLLRLRRIWVMIGSGPPEWITPLMVVTALE